jgi:hypothetical protein
MFVDADMARRRRAFRLAATPSALKGHAVGGEHVASVCPEPCVEEVELGQE